MENPFSLSGKTILITGASSGIGKATAIECAKMGAQLIISARNKDRLLDTLSELVGEGHRTLVADFNNENIIEDVVHELPLLDGMVHAAGITETKPFQFVNEKNLKDIFHINFDIPVLLSQRIVKEKKINHNASIVFISSIDGNQVVTIGNSMYAASKCAVTGMAKNMAVDLAPRKIRVNCICPGMVETPFIHSDSFTQEQLHEDMQKYPLKRYGKPEEIAWAAVYLLSDASTWTTGTQLVIDGGFTLF